MDPFLRQKLAEIRKVRLPGGMKSVAANIGGLVKTGLRQVGRGLWWVFVRFGRGIIRHRKAILILAGLVVLAVVGAGAVLAGIVTAKYSEILASPSTLASYKDTGTTIYDANGTVLYRAYGAPSDTPVTMAAVPTALVRATLAAEDPSFYQDPAVSPTGILRSAWADIRHGNIDQGGSTLTQELVKNAVLAPNKSFKTKFEEIVLSIEMTKKYSANQIMNIYLNSIYYGEGSYGVGQAAETYFHTPVSQLTLAQSAMLAGLPLGPSRFDPNFDQSAAVGRRNYVLDRMNQLGYISAEDFTQAEAEPLTAYANQTTIQAPQFVFYVLDQLRSAYGEDEVERGGLKVYTTLDWNKQQSAQRIVNQQVAAVASHNVSNGGLISLDPKTGAIVTMVGSVDYDQPNWGQVNTTLSEFQPGSSFKPFEYAVAFEKGWNGATMVDDSPLTVPLPDGTTFTPTDYSGKFQGPVTLRHALDNSLNIPAVKVLQYAGISQTVELASQMGVTTLADPASYGPALALGAADVRPIDMATAYAAIDNGGQRVSPYAITKVLDRNQEDITKSQLGPQKSVQVLDPRVAYMLTDILADNDARQPEFPADSVLNLGRPAAAKTGTTNDFRDNWTIGFTPQVVTAVWVGNDDHSAMVNIDGITGAGPIWHDYMQEALAGTFPVAFTVPEGVEVADVCRSQGLLASVPTDANPNAAAANSDSLPFFTEPPSSPGSGGDVSEVFLPGEVPTQSCYNFPSVAQSIDPNQASSPAPTPTGEYSPGLGGNDPNQGNDNGFGDAPSTPDIQTPVPLPTPPPNPFQ